MATKEQYENALIKVEKLGLGSPGKQELKLLVAPYKEMVHVVTLLARLIDGK